MNPGIPLINPERLPTNYPIKEICNTFRIGEPVDPVGINARNHEYDRGNNKVATYSVYR